MRKAAITEKEAAAQEGDSDPAPEDRLEQMNVDLRNAVQDERYEDAARIRDEIQKLKEKIRGKE